jgi:hypothetical protein
LCSHLSEHVRCEPYEKEKNARGSLVIGATIVGFL